MKILKKTLVAAGIATAVSATGAAQAATIDNHPSTAATPTFAEITTNESTRTTVDTQAIENPIVTATTAQVGGAFELILGAGEQLSEDDSLTLTLSNGATFATIDATSIVTAVNTGNPAAGNVALVSGGVGSSEAVFRVTAGGIAALSHIQMDDGTTGTAVTFNLSAVPDSSAVTITAAMSGFVGGVATSLYGSPLVYNAYQLAPARTAAVTAATNGIFDVATGFTTLTTSAAAPSTSTAATVVVTNSAGAVTNQNTAGAPAAAPTIGNVFLVMSGPMTGVSAITATTTNAATSAGAAATPAATGFAVDAANNMAYAIAGNVNMNDIAIVFDGTSSYDASSYSVQVSSTTDAAGYAANTNIGSGTTHTFTRNGSSFTTNSFGPLNKLTVTDRSGGLGTGGADGAINITAYDAAGAVVTCTGLSIANIPNNGTTTIQGTDITDNCPGVKRIEGIVNSTSILSTNTKITSDGATFQSGNNSATTIAN